MSDTPPDPLDGLLSDFSLGPAWARSKSESKKERFKDGGEREYKPRRQNDRGRNDARRGGGGSPRRDDRGRGRNDRRDFKKGDRQDFRREEIPPTPGVGVSLLPKKESVQVVCKEIQKVARVYSLYDIAKIILSERSRSHVVFEVGKKKDPFFVSKFDDAVFLTKEEAVQHLLRSDWRNNFIHEEVVEIDPPKGNFQSVAKCGISGEWLGPPNYHAYQSEIRRIHRERFSNMPFEVYSAKVRTERSEEAVNEWLESMKSQPRWCILKEGETIPTHSEEEPTPGTPQTEPSKEAAEEPVETSSEPTEPSSTAPSEPEEQSPETTATSSEDTEATESVSTQSTESPSTKNTENITEPADSKYLRDEINWITDRAEVERTIATTVIERAFKMTRRAQVSAEISARNLSPGLLARLKGTGNHHRKHPAIIIPPICKILDSEHMPVFKRNGKLFTGPARPNPLAPEAILAPRPAEMVTWIRKNPPAKLEGLWKAVLPEGSTAPPAEYAADLFWLLQQGHILLHTDDTLIVQEQPKPQEPKKKKAKKAPETESKTSDTEEPNQKTTIDATIADDPSEVETAANEKDPEPIKSSSKPAESEKEASPEN
ncbi:MAG: hypothetical protein AB8D78_03775 [Akkermansiaceae bacterium]